MKNWIIGALVTILVIALIASFASSSDDSSEPMPAGNTVATASPTPAPTPTAPPALSNSEILEKAEDCLDPWDSNHNGFEDQVRPLLDDEDSMSTLDTRLGTPNDSNELLIEMDYEADNMNGVSVKTTARGRLNYETCRVTVEETGVQKVASSWESPPLQERIERCLSFWDGNHVGFENQIRPFLNDEGSMQTHDTYYGMELGALGGSRDEVGIRMIYSAKNAFGARIKTEAVGRLNIETCRVTVLLTGLE